MGNRILENTDDGRLALEEYTMSSGLEVYYVLIRDTKLRCGNKEIAEGLYSHLKKMVDDFDIII